MCGWSVPAATRAITTRKGACTGAPPRSSSTSSSTGKKAGQLLDPEGRTAIDHFLSGFWDELTAKVAPMTSRSA